MIAALGMYDLPALHPANDRFWTAIRARLGTGPDRLTRDMGFWDIWQSPDLLFAQTCGMPYRTELHGRVRLIGTPDYGLDGCPPGYYRSALVVRAEDPRQSEDDFAGSRFAYNEARSQSGWSAPMVHLRARSIEMGTLIQTGAHASSAHAVADGRADLAGIDALTWALLMEHDPKVSGLRVLSWTEPTPGLPYITALTQDANAMFPAIEAAITDLSPKDRSTLHLRGLVKIPADAYLAVPTPPPPAT